MAVKIRLQRKGRKKAPFYFIVVADTRSPRDGRSIERIGSYNPVPRLAQVDVDIERAIYWLEKGATPTKTVRSLLSGQGVLYRKHLLRGVQMGILTLEDADIKFAEYIKEKENKRQKEVDKLKASEDKVLKASLEKESKTNEKRIKELMEKRQAELKKKHTEQHSESEEVVADENHESTDSEAASETEEQEKSEENN